MPTAKQQATDVAKSPGDPHSTFATRLAVLRGEKRMTVAELAMQAGLHRQAVVKYESGQRQPTWAAVQSLADALGVPTDELRAKDRAQRR